MATYLVQGSYSAEAWSAMAKQPQNRRESVRELVESLGGSLNGCWMAFGDYDFVIIADFPDDLRAAACAITVSGTGALKHVKTTPLLSPDDAMTATSRPGGSAQRTPLAAMR